MATARELKAVLSRLWQNRHLSRSNPTTLTELFQREFYRQSGEGGWITIGGSPGDSGKHVGGTPVKIGEGGKIEAGPRALAGKTLGQVDKGVAGTAEDRRDPPTPSSRIQGHLKHPPAKPADFNPRSPQETAQAAAQHLDKVPAPLQSLMGRLNKASMKPGESIGAYGVMEVEGKRVYGWMQAHLGQSVENGKVEKTDFDGKPGLKFSSPAGSLEIRNQAQPGFPFPARYSPESIIHAAAPEEKAPEPPAEIKPSELKHPPTPKTPAPPAKSQSTMFPGIAPAAKNKKPKGFQAEKQKKLLDTSPSKGKPAPEPENEPEPQAAGPAVEGGHPYPTDAAGHIQPWGEKILKKPPPGVKAKSNGRWVGNAVLHRDDIVTDPKRFQYKIDVGAEGVSSVQKEVKQFVPQFGGVVQVWRDPKDGKTYCINGHHRMDIAHRSPFHDAKPDNPDDYDWHGEMMVQYINAGDEAEARAQGALTNIAEGHGTALDAANFLRETGRTPEDLAKQHISLKGSAAKDAGALASLSNDLFKRVHSGLVTQSRAVAIGSELKDHRKQDDLYRTIQAEDERRSTDLSDEVVRTMARRKALSAEYETSQTKLWGEESDTHDTFVQESELENGLKKNLNKVLRHLSGVSASGAKGIIESRGAGQIDVEKAKEEAAEANRLKMIFDIEIDHPGPLNQLIKKLAKEYANDPRKERSRTEYVNRLVEEAVPTLQEILGGGMGKPLQNGANTIEGGAEVQPQADWEASRRHDPRVAEMFQMSDLDRVIERYARNRYNARYGSAGGTPVIELPHNKAAKFQVNYRPAFSHSRCENCAQRQGDHCARVLGQIRDSDVCELYIAANERFSASELARGIDEEMREHNMSKDKARKTAEDHLRENPHYYTIIARALKENERYAKKKPAKNQEGLGFDGGNDKHWVTMEPSGTHVLLGGGGKIEGGPKNLQGQNVDHIESAEGQRDLFGGETHHKKPEPPKYQPQEAPKAKQTAMFHGLKDLPGKQDLFNADLGVGTVEPETPMQEAAKQTFGVKPAAKSAKITTTKRKSGDGFYHSIINNGKKVGHIGGFEDHGQFDLTNTELSDPDMKGSGAWQAAIQQVADQYPKGLRSLKYQTSQAAQKAFRKISGIVETNDEFRVMPKGSESESQPAAPQAGNKGKDLAAKFAKEIVGNHARNGFTHGHNDFRRQYNSINDADKIEVAKELRRRGLAIRSPKTPLSAAELVEAADSSIRSERQAFERIPTNRYESFADSDFVKHAGKENTANAKSLFQREGSPATFLLAEALQREFYAREHYAIRGKFEEDKHPRGRKGSDTGGRFVKKGNQQGASVPPARPTAKAPSPPVRSRKPRKPAATNKPTGQPQPVPKAGNQPAIPPAPHVPASFKNAKILQSLWKPEETQLPEKKIAPQRDEHSAYQAAQQDFMPYKAIMNMGHGVTQEIGGEVFAGGFKENVDRIMNSKKPAILIAKIKEVDRAAKKAQRKYKGDWGRMQDLVRGTVAVDTVEELPGVIEAVRKHAAAQGWKLATAPEDGFTKPSDMGYRDIKLALEAPDGHITELQVQLKQLFWAKEIGEGHKIYEEYRDIREPIDERVKEGGSPATPEEKAKLDELIRQSRALYDPIWAKINNL